MKGLQYIWDELGASDDHIVPHPSEEIADKYRAEARGQKRTHAEILGTTNDEDSVAPNDVSQRKEERILTALKEKEMMLEKVLWCDDTFDGTSGDGDSNNMNFISGSDEITDLRNCMKNYPMESVGVESYECDPIRRDQGAAMNGNMYPCVFSRVPSSEEFSSTDQQDKETSDLLCYGWPSMEDFEDVDRMFRSCDSTFGVGIDDEDDLSWLSSDQAVEGHDDVLKSNLKFQGSDAEILTEHHEDPIQDESSMFGDDSARLRPCMATSEKLTDSSPDIGVQSTLTNEYRASSDIDNEKQRNAISKVAKNGPSRLLKASHPEYSVSCQKQVMDSENGSNASGDVNGNKDDIQSELDSSNAQGSCSIDSVSGEPSAEAISFRQLQHVMNQLDLRTKLCIRDSLYRLGRSAEQRHKCGNSAEGSNRDKDGSLLTSDGTNKGLMDVETDTNPIDRSIAHLLFHRPSETSHVPTLDLSPKFKVRGSSKNRDARVQGGVATGKDNAVA
ncbi:LNK1-like protein [Drosera capensis]